PPAPTSTDTLALHDALPISEYLASRARRTSAAAPPSDLTVNELLLLFWDHARSYYVKDGRPTSEPETIRQALRPVRELYGDSRADRKSTRLNFSHVSISYAV